MARGLDRVQKAELVAFLESLYRLGGYTGQAQWAREAGFYTPNLSRAMSRRTNQGVDGYSLLRLIRAAAARAGLSGSDAVMRLAQASAYDAVLQQVLLHLAELEEKVASLPTAEDLGRTVAAMREAIESQASRDTRGDQQDSSVSRGGNAQ